MNRKIVLLFLGISFSLRATEEQDICDPCMECIPSSYCEIITPPGRPFAPECWGFYVTIEPFVWKPHVTGLSFAIEISDSISLFNTSGQSDVKDPNFNWDWGFRFGLGCNTNHDGWDVFLRWTNWKTDAKKDLVADVSHAIYPRIGHPQFIEDQIAQSAQTHWNMDYNILDLENGREFCISPCVTLRPFAGLRTIWIDQEWKVRYKQLASPNLFTPFLNIHQRDCFWALGILGGINMHWTIIGQWGIFSNFAGSVLYGYHKITHLENTTDEQLFVKDFHHIGTAIFDTQIGIRWSWISCDQCFHVSVDLGWENHWYPGQNQFLLFVDQQMTGKFVINQGDLGIQGFFAKFLFDF